MWAAARYFGLPCFERPEKKKSMEQASLVHVIDDDEAMRDSLAFLLAAARLDVRTYDSAGAFLSVLPSVKAGCIVTDVRMPDMNGVDLLRRLNDLNVRLPVIVITGHGDVQLAVEAMKAGAADFIEKPFDDEVLLAAIRSALTQWQGDAQRTAERNDYLQRLAALSAREREVLEGLIAGKANKVIAYDLGISPRTVEIYRANVMTKTGANSLPELVRMALISGTINMSQK
jgi:two-component system response regulator FixJ